MSCITYINSNLNNIPVTVSGKTCGGVFSAITLTYGQAVCMDNTYQVITCGNASIASECIQPTPPPSPSITPTQTPTSSIGPTNTPTSSIGSTPTITPTITETPTITPTITSTPGLSPTVTMTQTPTNTETPSLTPTNTQTNTPTSSITPTLTPTSSEIVVSVTPTLTQTNTPTLTPTNTQTPTNTPTSSIPSTPTPTPTSSTVPSCVFEINVDNNATDIDIDNVEVNLTSVSYVSGDNFPVAPTQLGTFESSITGTSLTIDISYDASAGDKNINLTDCASPPNVFCQSVASSGTGVVQFEGVYANCDCLITITIEDGACI